jgi:flagellum-specific ATP synthase
MARHEVPMMTVRGVVSEVAAGHYRVRGLSRFLRLGECVRFDVAAANPLAEVVRVDESGATVKPYDPHLAVGLGLAVSRADPLALRPHTGWKGRVVDALGRPVDDGPPLPQGDVEAPLNAPPPHAMQRARVGKAMRTGVRVIDFFTPLCAGQRIGIFAGSGVGKSTLLSMLVRATGFDTVVIGLVGERGREVRELLDKLASVEKAVTVVSTGDEGAMMRRLAPKTAMSLAEYFRDRGDAVLLVVDSVTRFAHAARDVALAAGEPAVARGFPPSVFSELPKLLERAGPGDAGKGSITGIFSVLVDGDDHNDPIADSIRGTLDGHIVLDRAIADQGRYPPVNVLASVSRLANSVWTPEKRKLALKLRGMIARFEDTRDLRLMGGYHPGVDTELDQAVAMVPKIYEAMAQDPDARPSEDAFRELAEALKS